MQHSFSKFVLIVLFALSSTLFAQENSGPDSLKNISLAGLSFRSIGPSVTGGRIIDIAVNPFNFSEYFVASGHGSLWKTTNSGVTFTPVFDGNKSYAIGSVKIDPTNSNVVWVGTGENNNQNNVIFGDGIYKSEDGGKSWKNMGISASHHIGGIVIDPNNSNIVYAAAYGSSRVAGGDRGIFKTTDGGETWNDMNFSFFSTDKLYDVDFRSASDLVVVGNNGGVFHTSNNGTTWTQFNLGLANFFSGQMLGVDFSGPNEVVVGGAASQLIKVELNNVVPVELVSFSCEVNYPSVKLHWVTATELNNQGFEVERKTSESDQWKKIGSVNGRGTITTPSEYYFNDENLTSGKYNYRIKQIDFDGSFEYSEVITADLSTPSAFELGQNYPNPFNPSTRITYSIPKSSFVTLKVYDILGNEIATLVNQTQDAGNYNVSFNAENLSNGIYIYSLNADNFTDVKKMILMK